MNLATYFVIAAIPTDATAEIQQLPYSKILSREVFLDVDDVKNGWKSIKF